MRADHPLPVLMFCGLLLAVATFFAAKGAEQWFAWDEPIVQVALDDATLERYADRPITLVGARCGAVIHTQRSDPFNGDVQWLTGLTSDVAAVVPCHCRGPMLQGCTGLLRRLEPEHVAYLSKRGYSHPKLRFGMCTGCDRESAGAALAFGALLATVALGGGALVQYGSRRSRK